MIARTWTGWTELEDAGEYEKVLRETVLPSLNKINGYLGTQVMRKDGDKESKFMVVNFFDSMDSVKEFAGENFEVAVFEPEARRLLSRVENVAEHFVVRIKTNIASESRPEV